MYYDDFFFFQNVFYHPLLCQNKSESQLNSRIDKTRRAERSNVVYNKPLTQQRGNQNHSARGAFSPGKF